MFRATSSLLQACRITLFTRNNCGLCTNAKEALRLAWDIRPFRYEEVDIMTPEAKSWRDLYDFDVPVIHVRNDDLKEDPIKSGAAHKLMHRFTPDAVVSLLDKVAASAAT